MKITGVKSICHSKSVKLLPPTKRYGDTMYLCLECNKPCDHYYEAEIERVDVKKNKSPGDFGYVNNPDMTWRD